MIFDRRQYVRIIYFMIQIFLLSGHSGGEGRHQAARQQLALCRRSTPRVVCAGEWRRPRPAALVPGRREEQVGRVAGDREWVRRAAGELAGRDRRRRRPRAERGQPTLGYGGLAVGRCARCPGSGGERRRRAAVTRAVMGRRRVRVFTNPHAWSGLMNSS